MATGNRMSELVNKIERRLGTKPLLLPPDITKDKWPEEAIIPDSITTFSRFYPRKITIPLTRDMLKGGWYYIDKDLPDNIEILGVKDIDWESFNSDSFNSAQAMNYGYYDNIATNGMVTTGDVMQLQMIANYKSICNNGIFVEFEPPNRVRFKSAVNTTYTVDNYPLDIFIKHAPNLMTISPTMMETFEKLAIADVAVFLYEYLKYYDDVDTVFAHVDFKLDRIEQKASQRDDIVKELEDSYVNPANTDQPIIICQ